MQGDVWAVQMMNDDGETSGFVFAEIYAVADELLRHSDIVQWRIERVTTDGLAHKVCEEVDRATAEALAS